jgi:hypothetical protein
MLLEVIAAIAVVAVGLTAFASGIPVASMAVSEGARLSTATFLAAERMEAVRGIGWRSGSVLHDFGLAFPDESALPTPYAAYSRQVRIVDCGVPPGCDAVTSPLLRQVTVTVAYRPVTASGMGASDKAVSLTTLIAER